MNDGDLPLAVAETWAQMDLPAMMVRLAAMPALDHFRRRPSLAEWRSFVT